MAQIDPLPPSLVEILRDYPPAGERNLWLFTVAARARNIASPTRVRRFLQQAVQRNHWTDRDFTAEIDRAVHRAFNTPPQNSNSNTAARPSTGTPPKGGLWPPFDPAAWPVYSRHNLLFDLDPLPIDPATVLDALYPPDALLCLALDIRSALTQPRPAWRGKEAALQFIVPNPMTAPTGLTQDGRPSQRCHGNATRSRTYQVVEFDRGTPEEQAAILSSLHDDRAPLVLVVWSGGKSMHGWFDVRHLAEPDKANFFAQACQLGADPSLWDPCKLVRMPGGRRPFKNSPPSQGAQPGGPRTHAPRSTQNSPPSQGGVTGSPGGGGHTQHILDYHPELLRTI